MQTPAAAQPQQQYPNDPLLQLPLAFALAWLQEEDGVSLGSKFLFYRSVVSDLKYFRSHQLYTVPFFTAAAGSLEQQSPAVAEEACCGILGLKGCAEKEA